MKNSALLATPPLAIFCFLLLSSSAGDPQGPPAPLPSAVSGVVLSPGGQPMPEVAYAVVMEHSESNGSFSGGIPSQGKTGQDGRFSCTISGASVSIVFQHQGYAPTWVSRVAPSDGEQTVHMDKGVELKGNVVGNDDLFRMSSELSDAPTGLSLRIWGEPFSRVVTIRGTTDSKGAFVFRVPTKFWEYHYAVVLGAHQTQVTLKKDAPIPHLTLSTERRVSVEPTSVSIRK